MLTLIEFCVIGLLLAFNVTQVMIPIINDRPMFPMFRRRVVAAYSQLRTANEKSEVEEIKRRIK